MERDDIKSMLRYVWDQIGGDTLRAMEEAGEEPILPASHVVEIVMDCYYHGRDYDEEAYAAYQAMSSSERLAVATEAFSQFKRYGW